MGLDIIDELTRDMWNLSRRSLEPLTTISETDEKVIVEFDLPLVKKENIHIRLVEDGLELEASLTHCVNYERWGTVQRRCEFRSFFKKVPLPSPIVAEGAKATFRKGLLRIELKKWKEAEHEIQIE